MKMHNLKDTKSMSEKEINLLICVDNNSCVFKDRSDLIVGARIMKEVMSKWGLMMHACSADKNVKLRFYAFHAIKKSETGEVR